MIAQARAELLKIRSTRTTLGLLLGLIGLAVMVALLTGLLTTSGHLTGKEDQRELFGSASLAGSFAALAGIMLVTSEYRFGTIRPTLLYTPQRVRVLAAKLIAGMLAGLVFGVIGEGLVLGIGYAVLDGRGIGWCSTAARSPCSCWAHLPASLSGERLGSDSPRPSETRSVR